MCEKDQHLIELNEKMILNIENIFNYSWTSNSFDSVCHTLISMQEQFDWDNDVLFIGIPPLWRLTVFDNYKNTQYLRSKCLELSS